MRKLARASISFAIGLGFSVSAHAQTTDAQATVNVTADPNATSAGATTNDASDNALQLRDGSYLRGRVVDMRPGQYVIVVNPAGQRTVAWSDIVHAEGPSFPGGYNAMAYGAQLGMAAPVAEFDYLHPQPGRVPLVIESTGPVMDIVESFGAGPGRRWRGSLRPICTTPCTLYVEPTAFAFHARSRGNHTVNPDLAVPSTGMRVRLRTTSNARYLGSIGLMGGGGAAVITGITLIAYGAAFNGFSSSYPYGGSPHTIGDGFIVGGGIAAGLGAAAIVTGVILFVTSPVGIESSSPLPAGEAGTAPRVTIGPLSEGGVMSSVSGRF